MTMTFEEVSMKRELKMPDPDTIGPDTPLRLDVAAALAFPGGGMTASSLRHEHAKGRLRFERIANKDFVTLRQINEMRQRCVVDLSNTQRKLEQWRFQG